MPPAFAGAQAPGRANGLGMRRSLFFKLFSNRLAAFSALSVVLCAIIVLRAWNFNSCNFYATAVHLSRSNSSMMAMMCNMFFAMLLLAKLLQRIIFGELRTVELDHLYERCWLTVTEMLIAMTIFRDGMYLRFTFFFTLMLFLKGFHWISADRVDYMEHTPNRPRRDAAILLGFMIFLLSADVFLVFLCINHVLGHGRSVMILFGFEFVIMTATMLTTMARNAINAYNIRQGHLWENKSLWTFYLDLVYDMFKLACFLGFFVVITTLYRFPLNIIRDFYLTLRSFVLRVRDLVRYRRATSNMDTRYPDATVQELSRFSDRTCIICREDMFTSSEQAPNPTNNPVQARSQVPKRLPCNHIFHFGCLRSWLERQQSCPTCRRSVLDVEPNQQPQQPQPQQPGIPQQLNQQQQQQQVHPQEPAVINRPGLASVATASFAPAERFVGPYMASGPQTIDPTRLETILQRCLDAAFATIPPPPPPLALLYGISGEENTAAELVELTDEEIQQLIVRATDRATLEKQLRLLGRVHRHVQLAQRNLTQLLAATGAVDAASTSPPLEAVQKHIGEEST